MINKAISEIAADDLDQLVAAHVEEGPQLDFKQALVGVTRDDKKAFIADVCAFANAHGGDLVFGIAESAAGEASGVVPLTFVPDDEILRLENMISDSMDPKLFGVRMRAVPYGGGHVLVVRVPQSIQGLHRSKADQHFYVRESRSNRQLDTASVASRIEGVLFRRTRLEDFLAERYAAVLTNITAVPLMPGPKAVVHMFPGLQGAATDILDLSRVTGAGVLPYPGRAGGADARMCYEGAMHHSPLADGGIRAYSLLHYSGVFEGVVRVADPGTPIHPELVEGYVLRFVNQALPVILERTALQPPLVVRSAIVGGEGATISSLNRDIRFHFDDMVQSPIRRSVLILPDVVIPTWPVEDLPRLFRPSFDRLWQSGGYPRSFLYQPDGGAFRWRGEL
jgi:hypothetical protein